MPAAYRLLLPLSLWASTAYGTQSEDECLLNALKNASASTTATALRAQCVQAPANQATSSAPPAQAVAGTPSSAVSRRLQQERNVDGNPFGLTAHKRNYILPITYNSNPNNEPYQLAGSGETEPLDKTEAKFQLSVKVPLIEQLLTEDDRLDFAFTVQSYWQVYNDEFSSPFRETNYNPELFYQFGNDWKLGGWTNSIIRLGAEHQSNGRTQLLSRSWNRLYAQFVFENDNWAIAFKPWYRLPEDGKDDPLKAEGDDNPDIDDYMGYFELNAAALYGEHEFGAMLRNNLRSENKGALQLDWSFPLYGRLRGYAQYFNGYGESLIDYNASSQRVGVGILLTDVL